jgi:hypothetical protein
MTGEEMATSEGWLAWRYWGVALVVGVAAMYPALIVVSLVSHWLHLPWNWFARAGIATAILVAPAIFAIAMVRIPPPYRWWPRVALISLACSMGVALLTTLALGLLGFVLP